MRTSLIEIERIDRWLLGKESPQEELLMQAKLELDTGLKKNADAQKLTHHLISRYGREKLRNEIMSIESKLLSSNNHWSFQDRVKSIFNF